jgi:N-acetylmuramoyl-L-alanine amidase
VAGILIGVLSVSFIPMGSELQAQSEQESPINNPKLISPMSSEPAVIERLSFSNTGKLSISANQSISYQTSLDQFSRTYKFIIPNSRISRNLQRPSLAANSPIERIRLLQVGGSVEIEIKMIFGWQVQESQQTNQQQIQLQVSLNRLNPNNALPNRDPILQVQNQNIGDRRRGLIVVDAGHGGRDPGAIGNGVQEKDITLSISIRLGQTLQSMGYAVYYTRTNDSEIDLEPRVADAERIDADVFVSVHANALAANNSGINGIETYHSRNSTVGKELATYVHSQILSETGANDRSVRGSGFYVIARTSMPAILVETGFVTNALEAQNLSRPDYQQRMAEAIAKGIDRFMRTRGR